MNASGPSLSASGGLLVRHPPKVRKKSPEVPKKSPWQHQKHSKMISGKCDKSVHRKSSKSSRNINNSELHSCFLGAPRKRRGGATPPGEPARNYYTLKIVGADKSEIVDLNEQSKNLGLESRVTFLRRVGYSDVAKQLSSSSIGILINSNINNKSI